MGLPVILSFLLAQTIEQRITAHSCRSPAEFNVSPIDIVFKTASRVPASTLGTTADWILLFLMGLSLGAALFAFVTLGQWKGPSWS